MVALILAPGSVNMQQAKLGTSLNMFGGAKGGDPSKMDASSLMGGSSGMMSGTNSVMTPGGSSGGSTGASSGGGINLNPMNMMSSMTGGSGSGSGSGTNPMNAIMGGTSATSRGGNSGSTSQSGGQTGGNPLDPLGAMMGGAQRFAGGSNLMDPMGFMNGGGQTGKFGNRFSVPLTGRSLQTETAFVPGDLGFLGKFDPNQYFQNSINNKKAWKQTWDGSWPNKGGSQNELTKTKATPSEVDIESSLGNTDIKEGLVQAAQGNNNHHEEKDKVKTWDGSWPDSDTAKSWAGAWKQEKPGVPESTASITDREEKMTQETENYPIFKRMASKALMCDPCSRLNKSSNAIKFCTDCNDALCTDCTTVHSALKITSSHHVVDGACLTDRAFKLNKYCNDHQDMPLEFFCADHDCLLCRSCMANTHRTCGKILPIDVAAKGIKSSVMFDDICKDIDALRNSTNQLVQERRKNKTQIGRSKETILQKIKKLRSDINKRLDNLEKKMSSDVDNIERELIEKVSTGISEAETRAKEIEYIRDQVDFLTEHGSESQMLILLNTVRTEITKQSINFQEIILSLEMNGLDFEQVDLISAITSMGLVKQTSSLCSVSYLPPKRMQAQIQQLQDKEPTKFELENKIHVSSGRISCIAVTDDNILLMCNDMHCYFKNNVIACKDTGEQIQACTISNRVFGISLIPHTKEAVVSLNDTKILQFVNISSMKPGRQLQVTMTDPCMYGIAIVRDTIIVGGSTGNVYIIEKINGKCLKTLKVGTGCITSVVPFLCANDELLYCCEYSGKKKLYSMKLGGTLISSCDLKHSIGMTLDSKGNLYVACHDSNELHRLSPDCKVDVILLMKSDGIDKPMSVVFNKTFTKLYISNVGQDKSVLVFNCK
ncbi:unnamed protein product [Mytilus edulis]|uniref:B box-type domain-containing protein n=1 Tax=Mytilus edulis TaxID=6550 RepID=A0A8S3SRA7_MYTED|nr:unnamed protein product [Mytilus edulis]